MCIGVDRMRIGWGGLGCGLGQCWGDCWDAAGILSPSAMSCSVVTRTQFTKSPMCAVFQGHQQSSRPEAGGWDPHVIAEAHRQHRGHLLRLLHHLRHPGSAGERGRPQAATQENYPLLPHLRSYHSLTCDSNSQQSYPRLLCTGLTLLTEFSLKNSFFQSRHYKSNPGVLICACLMEIEISWLTHGPRTNQ